MSKYLAFAVIVIDAEDVNSQDEACDWMSALLTDNSEVFDWSYFKDESCEDGYKYPEEITPKIDNFFIKN